ncbi:hypothetical protein GCM10008986_32370 [Salinibacillus aidingensis]|uniref:Spore germination protein n=1 Tax=Salinibacillus aidingensis TaxID=237684 RepID=A0ABP3LJR2_9BACI
MSRYFYYLVILNMLANVVALVPRILIEERVNGVVTSLMIAIIITLIYCLVYTNSMLKFPGQGQPEIIKKYTPKWFASGYLFFIGILYFLGTWFVLLSFIDITKRFINPEMPALYISVLFLSIICLGALMKTEKTLYALEIIMIISLPLITGIFLKAFLNEHISWDAIRIVFTHTIEPPSNTSIGAGAYSLVGFYFISIYNRVLKNRVEGMGVWRIVLIGIAGTINIFTSLLVPIGMNGIDGAENYIYPWFSTADALRMEFGFIERVLYIFLLLYIGISMISATITCHIAMEHVRSVLPEIKWKEVKIVPVMMAILFSLATILGYFFLSQVQVYELAKMFFSLLLFAGAFSCAVLFYAVRRSKQK